MQQERKPGPYEGKLLEVNPDNGFAADVWIEKWSDDFPNWQPGPSDFKLKKGDWILVVRDDNVRCFIQVLSRVGFVWIRTWDLYPEVLRTWDGEGECPPLPPDPWNDHLYEQRPL
jgi:hypothetical protein